MHAPQKLRLPYLENIILPLVQRASFYTASGNSADLFAIAANVASPPILGLQPTGPNGRFRDRLES